jgi:hypothetical protein
MEVLRSVLGSTTELSPFGFALRTVFVGFLLWAEGKVLPHRSGGQFAGYDFVFFWMMGGITAAPLFDPESSFLNTVTVIIVIYLAHYLFSYLGVKNRTFAKFVFGQSVVLVSGGMVYDKVERGIASDIIVYSQDEFESWLPESSFLQDIVASGRVVYEKAD